MAISVIGVYQDVARDNVNSAENGVLPYGMFNRLSERAELRLEDYLTGDVEDTRPPFADLSQKNRDWISPFVTKKPFQVEGGFIERPQDYYAYDNLYLMGDYSKGVDCETAVSDEEDGSNTAIELLSRQAFYTRTNTYIKALKPTLTKPIAKQVGTRFEFMPKDIGSVTLEYIRLPKFAFIKTKLDPVYNDMVADESVSVNYEWPESARELLIWIITDLFSNNTREQALKQHNTISGKLVRDQK